MAALRRRTRSRVRGGLRPVHPPGLCLVNETQWARLLFFRFTAQNQRPGSDNGKENRGLLKIHFARGRKCGFRWFGDTHLLTSRYVECRYKGIQQCICAFGVRRLPYTTVLIPRDADADSVCGNEDNNRGCEKSDAPPKVSLHLHLIMHCRARGFDAL